MTYEWTVELTNEKNRDRYETWKHFGKYIEPGSIVVGSGYDEQARISSVAFHDVERCRLSVILLKMGEGEGTTKIADPNIRTPGKWFLSDAKSKWVDKGAIEAGESITMPGYSIATLVFEDYRPRLSRAKQMLKPRGRRGGLRCEREDRRIHLTQAGPDECVISGQGDRHWMERSAHAHQQGFHNHRVLRPRSDGRAHGGASGEGGLPRHRP